MPERSWAGFEQVKVGLGSRFWRFTGGQLEYAFIDGFIQRVPLGRRKRVDDLSLLEATLQLRQRDEIALGDDQIGICDVKLQLPDNGLAMLGRIERIFDIALRVAAFAKNGSQIDRGRFRLEIAQSTNGGGLRILLIHAHKSLRLLRRLAGFERATGGCELPGVLGLIARQDIERDARFQAHAVASHDAAGTAMNDIMTGLEKSEKFVEVALHSYRVRRIEYRLALRHCGADARF